MAEKSNKVDTRFYLDTYGYAQLAGGSNRLQISAMGEMYDTFLEEGDPVINRVLNEASIAKNHLMVKQQYDATPKEKRGDTKDPGALDPALEKSLQTVYGSIELYSGKRMEVMADLTAPELLAYNSQANGNAIVETPKAVKEAILNTAKKLGELGRDGPDGVVGQALMALDDYKIHGILNAEVERKMTKRRLAAAASGLEELAKPKK